MTGLATTQYKRRVGAGCQLGWHRRLATVVRDRQIFLEVLLMIGRSISVRWDFHRGRDSMRACSGVAPGGDEKKPGASHAGFLSARRRAWRARFKSRSC